MSRNSSVGGNDRPQCRVEGLYVRMNDNGKDTPSGAVIFSAGCGWKEKDQKSGEDVWSNFMVNMVVTKDNISVIDNVNFTKGQRVYISGGMKMKEFFYQKANKDVTSITVFVDHIQL